MRTSILTRSVISIASLAIGAVTLAATPATAAAPSGVTRDLVLAVAQNAQWTSYDDPDAGTLATRVCGLRDGEELNYTSVRSVQEPDEVDGVLVRARYFTSSTESYRDCMFAAFAPIAPKVTLSGTATLTGVSYSNEDRQPAESVIQTTALSGDVSVTEPVDGSEYYVSSAAAAGDVIRTSTSTTVTSRTVTPKTGQQKTTAKKARDSKIYAAKKAYTKAVKKARSSAKKKAVARKTFIAKKSAAQAAYRAATAGTLSIGTTTTSTTSPTPFSVTIVEGCGRFARC